MSERLHGKSLLLVEDEFLIMLDLQYMLEGQGARVTVASSVAEGLEKAEAPFDAAILDVRLPDGEVYPVAHKLDETNTPLIFHSGHAKSHDIATLFPDAVALTKPAAEKLLIDTVVRQATE